MLVWRFDPAPGGPVRREAPGSPAGVYYHMGVDGISLPFVILTTALMPLCIIASWEAIQTCAKEYMVGVLRSRR